MKAFALLLDSLSNAAPADRPAIEKLIADSFQRSKAVFTLDMAGFTLAVRRDGILHYLCRVRRMQRLVQPIVESFGGDVVKFEADNLLAVFDEPECAVDAAVAVNREAANLPGDEPVLSFSIGIDYGQVLLISGADCFGDAVNLAHKLGEDVARPGEILISDSARRRLHDVPEGRLQAMPLSVSGVELTAYKVVYARS